MRGILGRPIIIRVFNETDFLTLDVTVDNKGAGSCDFCSTSLQLSRLECFGRDQFNACRTVQKRCVNAVEFYNDSQWINGRDFADARDMACTDASRISGFFEFAKVESNSRCIEFFTIRKLHAVA